jgi:hypothetical protein
LQVPCPIGALVPEDPSLEGAFSREKLLHGFHDHPIIDPACTAALSWTQHAPADRIDAMDDGPQP